jgi:hypothetical protein
MHAGQRKQLDLEPTLRLADVLEFFRHRCAEDRPGWSYTMTASSTAGCSASSRTTANHERIEATTALASNGAAGEVAPALQDPLRPKEHEVREQDRDGLPVAKRALEPTAHDRPWWRDHEQVERVRTALDLARGLVEGAERLDTLDRWEPAALVDDRFVEEP